MKFIPTAAFETLNSLVQGVEALGCLFTMRLEAFTCRQTREEKQLAQSIAHRKKTLREVSPILQPQSGGYQHGVFPPMLSLDGAQMSRHSSSDPSAYSSPVTDAEEFVDERLVYLVAALNAIHGSDYDFTVLTEADFLLEEPHAVKMEVDNMLSSLPAQCQPIMNSERFWAGVAEQLVVSSSSSNTAEDQHLASDAVVATMWETSECFRFHCPQCDPIAQTAVWSSHFFLYNKKARVVVSILCFGEGNLYRGDDGVVVRNSTRAGGGVTGVGAGESESQSDYYCERSADDGHSSPCHSDGEYGGTSGKNRDYYGY